MAQKRIYQIAKELNISHLEILKFLTAEGISVEGHMALVDEDIYNSILLEFSKEKKQIDLLRREKARKAVIENKDITNKTKSEDTIDEKISDTQTSNIKDEVVIAKPLTAPKKADAPSKSEPEVKIENSQKELKQDSAKEVEPKTKTTLKKVDLDALTELINQSGKSGPSKNKISISKSLTGLKKSNKKKIKKKSVKEKEPTNTNNETQTIMLPEFTTVDELAQTMNKPVQEVIMKCMELGLMVTINQRLDMDTIVMVADEFDFEVHQEDVYAETEDIEREYTENLTSRPPIVTIMGHVDHGKTSLLDYIRNTNIIAGESGGITQHIGAYEVELENGNKITFIDTPGHAAFTAMRARGAQVTDVVVLIVSADDGIKPQTIEAIDHAQAANVPIVIAINKIDLPAANSENVKKQLSERNILTEDWGGKYQCAHISAKKGDGIDELLEKILLEAEVLDLKANRDCPAKGIIVESELDKGLGPIATVLIQHGQLKKGDSLLCGSQFIKVRELRNERGAKVDISYPSDPVQVLGFKKVPNAGDIVKVVNDEREGKKIALERSQLEREADFQRYNKITLEQIGQNIQSGTVKDLNIIIKGDVAGSIEALSDSLMSLSNEEVNVKIILKSTGLVTQNDVSLAGASNAIIVAFNISTTVNAKRNAKQLGVDIRHYSIIYEAIEEIKLALEGLLEPDVVEQSIGESLVKERFKIPKLGFIAGCSVVKGKVIKSSLLRLKRDGEVIYEGKLTSLKRFKEDVNEVKNGFECGIGIQGFEDFEENDIIEVYEHKNVKRKLK